MSPKTVKAGSSSPLRTTDRACRKGSASAGSSRTRRASPKAPDWDLQWRRRSPKNTVAASAQRIAAAAARYSRCACRAKVHWNRRDRRERAPRVLAVPAGRADRARGRYRPARSVARGRTALRAVGEADGGERQLADPASRQRAVFGQAAVVHGGAGVEL